MLLLAIDTLENADDRKFIEDLYTRYKPWLKYRAYKIVGDAHICEDLAQDCMVNMITHIHTLKMLTQAEQRSYLSISIDNIALNYSKRNAKIMKMNDADSSDLEFLPDIHNLETETEDKLEFEFVLKNIENLHKRDREIILMKFDLELSNEEIAAVLGIKASSVRMSVKRSVARLQKEIEERRGS